eukprot:scaffold159180_cov33-Tisochrysis_lutea.AAC.6
MAHPLSLELIIENALRVELDDWYAIRLREAVALFFIPFRSRHCCRRQEHEFRCDPRRIVLKECRGCFEGIGCTTHAAAFQTRVCELRLRSEEAESLWLRHGKGFRDVEYGEG